MEKNDQILLQLIYMFHTSALQGLGKIADPTGSINKNLDYVSQTIDLMEMLKEKTKGNTNEEVEKTLDQMISELQLNYVDEKSKEGLNKEKKKEDGEDKKEKISRIFSPTVVQIGLGWYFKKSDDIWVNLSPLASRGIFVGKAYTENLAPGQKYFGVERGKTNNVSIGASLTGHYKTEIMDNITVDNKFNFYVNYLEKIKNIDFEWNAKFILKVNERISSNLILHIQYDDDLINKLQIRELFGLGLSIDL